MVHLDFTWIPTGFQVEFDDNLAGLPAKEIPPRIQVESITMETMAGNNYLSHQ
jgi:hypothetical protein